MDSEVSVCWRGWAGGVSHYPGSLGESPGTTELLQAAGHCHFRGRHSPGTPASPDPAPWLKWTCLPYALIVSCIFYFFAPIIIFNYDIDTDMNVVIDIAGSPWWLRQQRICLQCRRPGFDPWIAKVPWRKEWLPTPVLFPGEFFPGALHGQRSLVGYSPWSRYFCFIDCMKAFDVVNHNKPWKILKEMRIPEYLTCLLRNLYEGQEAAVRSGHGTTDCLKIGKRAYDKAVGFPGASDGEETACDAGALGSIPGLGRSPGGGHVNPLQYSCLENPMDRGAWQATVHGSQRVRHD